MKPVQKLFGGSDAQLPPLVIPKPTPMPTPDDQAAKMAMRRSALSSQRRRGRQSTILQDNYTSDTLG